MSDIKYWGNSETIKFRYERNIFGFNLWSETRDIWGIMRRVRSFFQEKTNEYFNADNYQKLWNNDRKKLLEQCKKMNWIRDVLQEKIQFGCDKNFNKNKPWIDQLFYTQQKKEIISYIKEDLSIKISSESAINNWSDKKNLNDLIERVKKCNHQGETKISWWTRTTNKIRNYFKNTK